jgi:hypothetical protein
MVDVDEIDRPLVALAFHTREHGFSDRPEYVLVQGRAAVPTGGWLSCSFLPSASSLSAYSFDTIEANGIARLERNGASLLLRVNLTVRSSTFSIESIRSGMSMPAKYSQAVPATYWCQGWSAFCWRSKEKTTSSALKSRVGVKKSVVWYLTPGRSLKVYWRPSSETS